MQAVFNDRVREHAALDFIVKGMSLRWDEQMSNSVCFSQGAVGRHSIYKTDGINAP